MKLSSLALFLTAVVSADEHYYKPADSAPDAGGYLCGMCKDGAACDKVTGQCPDGCEQGYAGSDCQTSQCADISCSEAAGYCYDKNQCVCNKNYANDDEGGCYSMRSAGLKGSAAALCVIFAAITFCGLMQNHLMKGKKIE